MQLLKENHASVSKMHELTVSKISVIKSQSNDIGLVTAQLEEAVQLKGQLEAKISNARSVDVEDVVNVSNYFALFILVK